MSFPRVANGSEEETFNVSTTESIAPVGTKMVIEDGRTFRMAENGAVAGVCGRLFQSAVITVADNGAQAVGTIAAGETILTGVGATNNAVAADVLINGYLFVDTAAQLDAVHRVKANDAIAAAGTGNVTLFTALQDAIAGAETVSYIVNPYRNIIIHPSPQTANLAGVVSVALPADNFGWVATGGPCKVLVDGAVRALVNGDEVVGSFTTDGTVEIREYQEVTDADRARENAQTVGTTMVIGTDALYALIYLSLD